MIEPGGARARDLLLSVDARVGASISQQVSRHHARRLRRIGWERALDPPAGGWAAGEPPPRAGNAIEILIDGAHALPAIADELQRARSHVHLTGWFFTPGFALRRDREPPLVLRNLLADLAERLDVRVLAWAGAPLPLFRPSRRDVRAVRDELTRNTRVQCRLDSKERPMHCHHEKTIVIDDRVAFVGGIDLTSESGDRFDTHDHPPRSHIGWHDACARIEGPAVADVAESFRMRHDPGLATATRRRLWAEHLELSDEELPDDPFVAIEQLWKPISKDQLERRLAGLPLTHRLARLPNVSRRSSRAFGPISGLLFDG